VVEVEIAAARGLAGCGVRLLGVREARSGWVEGEGREGSTTHDVTAAVA
jgi:hypothetical protein